MTWTGVHTALVTPFFGGQVDLPVYRALCERQLRGGVQGLVACGTTGEAPALTEPEWSDLVRATLEVAAGAATVTAGVGTNCTATSLRRIELARTLGADAGLLVLPYYNKPPPDGLRAHVAACAAVGLPLVLYHVPGRTGQRVAPELLAELCATPGVVALKEATGDLAYANRLLSLTQVPALSGDDGTFLPFAALGGAGVVSVISDLAPAATVALWRALSGSDLSAARALHFRLLPAIDWLFHTTSPGPVKAALSAAGLCRNELRLPLVPFEGPVPAFVRDIVERG
jgi:4-hydroxy-tetrahydrodipicolinate synthase